MIDPAQPDYTNTPVAPGRPRFAYVPENESATPYVTIVTPFYDPDPFFHETVQSILQQSLQQWEWLIVSEGSFDRKSLSTLDRSCDRDPRIRIVEHVARGSLGAAWAAGFEAGRTSVVIQIENACVLEPTAIEKLCWCLDSFPDFAFVDSYGVGGETQECLTWNGFHQGGAFLDRNVAGAARAVRKKVYEDVGGIEAAPPDLLAEWDFWLRSAASGHWGGTIPEFLSWSRRRRYSDPGRVGGTGLLAETQSELRRRVPQLWNEPFPRVEVQAAPEYGAMSDQLPWENRLRNDKPRLLLIEPNLVVGGVEKFNLDLLAQLTHSRWEVTVAVTEVADHSWLSHFAAYTPDIFVLRHFLRFIDYPRFLRYLIASRGVSVVLISNSQLGYQLLPYLRAHHPGVTFVDVCHSEDPEWRNGGSARLGVTYQELLDLNLVTSNHLKRWMVEQGGDPRRMRVCYCNVDTEEWRPDDAARTETRRELGLDGDRPVILYAGRICAVKQPHVFAQSILELTRSGYRFEALVAGEGAELGWLRSFIRAHRLQEAVHLLGAVSSKRLRELMTAADILFLPSKYEGIALVIYEAMACGLCVVAADVGGHRELLTPECGVLVRPGKEDTQVAQYAGVLAELLADSERRTAMGRAGRDRVTERFRRDQMGERAMSLLREAMELHAAEPRPIPGLGLAKACAIEALECTRLGDAAGRLWREWNEDQLGIPAVGVKINSHLLDPYHAERRTLAYFAIRALLLPYYQALLKAKSMSWSVRIKSVVKRALLGGHRG